MPTKRYEVTVERKYIVFAEDRGAAALRALAHVDGGVEASATRYGKVLVVTELPPVDPRGEIIDRAPSRETRK